MRFVCGYYECAVIPTCRCARGHRDVIVPTKRH